MKLCTNLILNLSENIPKIFLNKIVLFGYIHGKFISSNKSGKRMMKMSKEQRLACLFKYLDSLIALQNVGIKMIEEIKKTVLEIQLELEIH